MKSAVIPEWLPGPATVETRPLRVDVWRIDLQDAADAVRERVRAALREILARYLRVDRSRVQIERTAAGKPYLGEPAVPLQFNLSHCRDLALIAVSAGCELGIDVERERPLRDPLRLARRVFSAEDYAALQALPVDRRLSGFFDLWTQLEARQKACGRGIFATPVERTSVQCVRLSPTPQHHACVCSSRCAAGIDLRFYRLQPLNR